MMALQEFLSENVRVSSVRGGRSRRCVNRKKAVYVFGAILNRKQPPVWRPGERYTTQWDRESTSRFFGSSAESVGKRRARGALLKVTILLKPAKDAGSNEDLAKDLAKNARLFHTSNKRRRRRATANHGNADGTGSRTGTTRSVSPTFTHRFR